VVNNRWEVAVTVSDGQFAQVSFVNSICTYKGGTHVTYIADQVVRLPLHPPLPQGCMLTQGRWHRRRK
jgi:DNA gyrase/topoisomerase IV subunit B